MFSKISIFTLNLTNFIVLHSKTLYGKLNVLIHWLSLASKNGMKITKSRLYLDLPLIIYAVNFSFSVNRLFQNFLNFSQFLFVIN